MFNTNYNFHATMLLFLLPVICVCAYKLEPVHLKFIPSTTLLLLTYMEMS